MVPEQVGNGTPEEIVCSIQPTEYGGYTIAQDMPTLLRKHYKEGDEVTYRIERVTENYYFLKDDLGYSTTLDKRYKINPAITQKLRCRIKSFGGKQVNVELVEKNSVERSQFTIGIEKLKGYFVDIDCAESITRLLLADDVLGSFDSECHRWICSICNEKGEDIDMLSHIKKLCLNVLEDSEMLNDCNENERQVLEERFTTLIEQLNYYIRALKIVEEEKEDSIIDDLMNKLQKTGYVYHPKKCFYIMMCIFLIKSKDGDRTEFLDTMMPKVFDTLRACDIKNWKREPFKIVWIKLLEFFIQSMSDNEDRLAIDKSALYNMVQSLALQYNLIDVNEEMLIDTSLNLAMLYRYCTKVGIMNPKNMLEIAFQTLIGTIQDEPRLIGHTSDPDRMVNIIYEQVKNFKPDTQRKLKYKGKDADLLVNNEAILIVPKDYDPENCHGMIPDYMPLWKKLQVELPTKSSPIAKASQQTIRPYKSLWSNAITKIATFNKKMTSWNGENKPQIDQTLGVIVTKQLAAETPTFECKVVDPENIKGTGIIRMADMVGYATPSVGLFSFEKCGKPLVFDAYVSDIDADGICKFESKDLLNEFTDEYRHDKIKYTDKVYCIVNSTNTSGAFYAVSENGMSVSVKYPESMEPIAMPKGTIIEVTNIEAGKPGFILAEFERIAPEKVFTLADTFGNLIRLYSNGEVLEIDEEETGNDEFEATDVIEKPKVKELMAIIDNIAALENDYIKAYNYMGFCKTLAYVIDEEDLQRLYKSKMELIELIYEFDVNDSISQELITKFQENNNCFFSQHTTIQRSFRKLQILSYLGSDSHNDELCEIACHASDQLAPLAQLITSFNFLKKTGMDTQAEEILVRIKEFLKLQKKENPKKDYGQETFTKEFKTSIVCPPDNKLRPDLARQTHKIMEEICAFLNAEGGTLYIGVDDKTHLERGIEEDLKYSEFKGSTDKYDVYVRNCINTMLVPGEVADHFVHTHFDNEAHTPVYVIEIKPSPRPISIDGVFYERRGTSSRAVSDDYKSIFIRERLQAASATEQKEISEIIKKAKLVEEKPEEKNSVAKEDDGAMPYDYSTDFEAIKTSQIRLHKHRADDVQPEDLPTYVNIFPDNTYSITPQLCSGCLSLGIYDEEQEGALVVVYTTGEIAKIPMSTLLKNEEWVPHPINNKSKIAFVSPVLSGQTLSVKYHSKNSDYYRFFSINKLDHGTFTTCMRPFYTGPIDEILECEVLTLSNLKPYKNFLNLDNDRPGADAKKMDGKKATKAINEQLSK